MVRPYRAKGLGFTLIELMVALTIVALLLSIVAPKYFGGVSRAEEAVLKENLYLVRDALDKYYSDKGRYPGTLEELVTQKYLRSVPADPMAPGVGWTVVPPTDPQLGGVFDVKSLAKGTGRDGRPYDQW